MDGRRARLFTTKKAEELRTVEVCVAAMAAAPRFGRSVLEPLGVLGGDRGTFEAITELVVPPGVEADAVIDIAFGSRRQRVLIEAKVKGQDPGVVQWGRYREALHADPRAHLLTVSNRIATPGDAHPELPDAMGDVASRIAHRSWAAIICLARREASRAEGVERTLLEDLHAFLKRPGSGTSKLDKLGTSWTALVRGLSGRTAPADDEAAAAVVRWFEAVGFVALDVQEALDDLGFDIPVRLRGSRSSFVRTKAREQQRLQEDRALAGSLLVGGKRLDVTLDLVGKELELTIPVELYGQSIASRIDRLRSAVEDHPVQVLVRGSGPDPFEVEPYKRRPDEASITRSFSIPRLGDAARGSKESFSKLFRRRVARFVTETYVPIQRAIDPSVLT